MRYNPKKHRLPAFADSGILLINKPKEWTSFDVVNFVRGRFNIPKVGHCGTLDPWATGLLVLVLGKFTPLATQLSGVNKVYEATLQLGIATDSQDITGEVVAEKDYSSVTEEALRGEIMGLLGKSMQLPPMVSAVKKDGKRLYELARKGVEVEREPREIEIFSVEIDKIEPPKAEFTVECSKGTYVRTICHDIGERLGCGGTLADLNRTSCGVFKLEDALTIEQIKEMEQADLTNYIQEFLVSNFAQLRGIYEQ